MQKVTCGARLTPTLLHGTHDALSEIGEKAVVIHMGTWLSQMSQFVASGSISEDVLFDSDGYFPIYAPEPKSHGNTYVVDAAIAVDVEMIVLLNDDDPVHAEAIALLAAAKEVYEGTPEYSPAQDAHFEKIKNAVGKIVAQRIRESKKDCNIWSVESVGYSIS